MIRALAFDVDNTLIDFKHFKYSTSFTAAKAMMDQD
jgi:FMN phosphatase YigB (HAD superfamily)